MNNDGNGKVRILEIGVGAPRVRLDRWPEADAVRVDLVPETEPDVVADPRQLPDDLGTFDVIVTNHVLQWVPRVQVIDTLRHWVDHLEPRGELHVIVPDLAWAADEISANRSVEKMTLGVVFGTQHAPWAYHRTGFTMDLLRTAIYAVGLAARAARVGPYRITSVGADGEVRELVARQLYVVGVKGDGDGEKDREWDESQPGEEG